MWFFGKHIGRNAIKESFDDLAAGLCYFNRNGLPILVNRTMDRLTFELLGHDLQYEEELQEAAARLEKRLFFSEDGKVWKIDSREMPGYGTEYSASDITTIYRNNLLLQEKNRQLQEMNAAIEAIGRNYAAIAREEEVLSMKMRIHSEMGSCGLSIRNYYKNGNSREQKQELVQKLREVVALLKGKSGRDKEENSIGELLRTAEAIGASIEIEGMIPEEEGAVDLLVLSMRECLINAIRHAAGDHLFVKIHRTESEYQVQITNNGRDPEGVIREGGGLSSLRRKIERAGGTMTILYSPRFCLSVILPRISEGTKA